MKTAMYGLADKAGLRLRSHTRVSTGSIGMAASSRSWNTWGLPHIPCARSSHICLSSVGLAGVWLRRRKSARSSNPSGALLSGRSDRRQGSSLACGRRPSLPGRRGVRGGWGRPTSSRSRRHARDFPLRLRPSSTRRRCGPPSGGAAATSGGQLRGSRGWTAAGAVEVRDIALPVRAGLPEFRPRFHGSDEVR